MCGVSGVPSRCRECPCVQLDYRTVFTKQGCAQLLTELCVTRPGSWEGVVMVCVCSVDF